MTQINHSQTTQQPPKSNSRGAAGPLVVSESNPRYFTVAPEATDRRVVYLTGSHINNNFHDGMGFMRTARRPGTVRLPRVLRAPQRPRPQLHPPLALGAVQIPLPGANVHFCMTPWPRSGPGTAKDGKPKFDLDLFDQAYFDRLRERVIAAGSEGIYASVMLFEGFSLHLTAPPDNIEAAPFHAANNNGERDHFDQRLPGAPADPRVQALQEAYMRKVIDTVHDLPNVLYEVANESSGGGTADKEFAEALGLSEPPDWGDTTQWQYWVIDVVKQYEQERGYDKHPIGMTMQFPVAEQTKVNDPLFNSPPTGSRPATTMRFSPVAWSRYTWSTPSRWFDNPPANDGAKVVLSDTDHYSPMGSDALWGVEAFLRGHNPVLYDLGIVGGGKPSDLVVRLPSYDCLSPLVLR